MGLVYFIFTIHYHYPIETIDLLEMRIQQQWAGYATFQNEYSSNCTAAVLIGMNIILNLK